MDAGLDAQGNGNVVCRDLRLARRVDHRVKTRFYQNPSQNQL
jgi:hypothetical protein